MQRVYYRLIVQGNKTDAIVNTDFIKAFSWFLLHCVSAPAITLPAGPSQSHTAAATTTTSPRLFWTVVALIHHT